MSCVGMASSRNWPSGAVGDTSAPVSARACDQAGQGLDVRCAGVERRDVIEALAAGFQEGIAPEQRYLLQSLQAVRRKARADDGDGMHTAVGQLAQGRIGGGQEPARATEARLKGERPVRGRKPERGGQALGGLPAVLAVAIAALLAALRDAMKGDQQMICVIPGALAPVLAYAVCQGRDVGPVGGVVGD